MELQAYVENQLIGKQGIYKESRQFMAVQIIELSIQKNELWFTLKPIWGRMAKYGNQVTFETLSHWETLTFEFGPVTFRDIQQQIEANEKPIYAYVMYIGELVLEDEATLREFLVENPQFWDKYV
ncbi:MAG TPA: hypothetical protein DCM08_03360 [Microscillaceae bacterium]|jgi:hypothetical protein|nr:hypothetical protein [Microscillaceae bacterium]